MCVCVWVCMGLGVHGCGCAWVWVCMGVGVLWVGRWVLVHVVGVHGCVVCGVVGG